MLSAPLKEKAHNLAEEAFNSLDSFHSIDWQAVDALIVASLKEDIGSGDITTALVLGEDKLVQGNLYLKQAGVIAGLPVFRRVFEHLSREVQFEDYLCEGAECTVTPALVAKLNGRASVLLAGERLSLNIIQRLSGIATLTRQFVDKVEGTGIEVRDTRKTSPGMRVLEKYAVAVGGGHNHRFGLFDEILVKDNHIELAGGIRPAVERIRSLAPDRHIELEVSCLSELKEALDLHVETIMLDNFSPEKVREAVSIVKGRAFIEVSGGIKLSNIQDYVIEGVDAISVGALTHSVRSLDLSLDIEV